MIKGEFNSSIVGGYQTILLINTCQHTLFSFVDMFRISNAFITFMFLLACSKYLHFTSAARHSRAKERRLNEGRLTAAIATCGWTGNEPGICELTGVNSSG